MKILIIRPGAYPHGMASTNRIHNYAKGFLENGAEVEMLIPRPTEKFGDKLKNDKTIGVYEGVRFSYTCGRTRQSRCAIGKVFWVLYGTFKAAAITLKISNPLVTGGSEFKYALILLNMSISFSFSSFNYRYIRYSIINIVIYHLRYLSRSS